MKTVKVTLNADDIRLIVSNFSIVSEQETFFFHIDLPISQIHADIEEVIDEKEVNGRCIIFTKDKMFERVK